MSGIYECLKCGAQSPKWAGRCAECGTWSSMQLQAGGNKSGASSTPADIVDLGSLKQEAGRRIRTNIDEADRVFGGGIVPGSLILLGGEPGIGKSTILAQIADSLKNENLIYASGEESALQVKNRLQRLNCDLSKIKFVGETKAEKISATAREQKASVLIVDSIQTCSSDTSPAEAGSVSQIRASAGIFLELAKKDNVAVILVGHITKDGMVAGPKTLEHIVDAVVYLEAERNSDYRILRAVKNRFGSVSEIGIFEMAGNGLQEVKNPGGVFLDLGVEKAGGSVFGCVMEGVRPFLVEIQALVSKTVFGYPQRKASGFDLNRLQVLSAVISKRTSLNLANQDIVLNVVGGLKVDDTALDLAICLAVAGSYLNKSLSSDTLVLGEVGLGGEVRAVPKIKERLAEAKNLGFKNAIIPKTQISSNLKLLKIGNLEEGIKLF